MATKGIGLYSNISPAKTKGGTNKFYKKNLTNEKIKNYCVSCGATLEECKEYRKRGVRCCIRCYHLENI